MNDALHMNILKILWCGYMDSLKEKANKISLFC